MTKAQIRLKRSYSHWINGFGRFPIGSFSQNLHIYFNLFKVSSCTISADYANFSPSLTVSMSIVIPVPSNGIVKSVGWSTVCAWGVGMGSETRPDSLLHIASVTILQIHWPTEMNVRHFHYLSQFLSL